MIANIEDKIGVMLNYQDRGATPTNFLHELAKALNLIGGQSSRWLIEQQDRGSCHQCARDLHESEFAMLQAIGSDIGEAFETNSA